MERIGPYIRMNYFNDCPTLADTKSMKYDFCVELPVLLLHDPQVCTTITVSVRQWSVSFVVFV